MSVTIADTASHRSTLPAPFPLWVGVFIYALLIVGGDALLNDPDTLWQVTIGQWILDHHAVPRTDVYSFTLNGQPWISTQWLAQVVYARAHDVAGWSGPVVLASAAIALTFALLARQLGRHLSDVPVCVAVMVALMLSVPHLLARPHVLAMPVMVLWIGGLIDAADRRAAPSLYLLPLLTLWANLHGGFVFGLFLVGAVALDAIVAAQPHARMRLARDWAIFGSAALIASCVTPYGWEALLASRRILSLGSALPLISEWRPADFGRLGVFEVALLAGIGLALYRGVRLPPMRIVLLLGLLHMALSQARAAEILAIAAPMLLAAPLARQIAGIAAAAEKPAPRQAPIFAALAMLMVGTVAYASVHRYEPNAKESPVNAVAELKRLNVARVFNDYDFGGYLIATGVPTFIDGRTELFGETFFLEHDRASKLAPPDDLFRLLDTYAIDATLLRTESPVAALLDHVDGWEKVYSDQIATIHLRKSGAAHIREPRVK